MTSMTLTLPWPSRDLSPNARVHGLVRHRAAKKAKSAAWGIASSLMEPLGIKRGTWRGPITVQYTFHPASIRDRDDDNFAAMMKASRDGIALALGVNDIEFKTMPIVFGEKRKPPCVVVTLTPAAVDVPFRGPIA